MGKRKRLFLFAVLLALVCLAGCAVLDEPADPKPYEGVWYFAKNAAECRVGDGKIYQDDYWEKDGQSLIGIYSEADDHIEANLSGVGGVQVTRVLYVVQTDAGEVLRDSIDDTVYFYRDAVAAMVALEETRGSSASEEFSQNAADLSPVPSSPEPVSEDPASTDELGARAMPGLDEDSSPEPQPTTTTTSTGTVWVSKTGSKYHKISTCSGMKSPTQISKSEAESRGLEPCKRCW